MRNNYGYPSFYYESPSQASLTNAGAPSGLLRISGGLEQTARGAICLFIAANKQLYEWFSPSVCPSVTPFFTMFPSSYHHETFMSHYQWQKWCPCKRSRSEVNGQVKVTEATAQLNRFRTVTPVWIHIWWWNDVYSLIMLRRGALMFLRVIRQISRSHGSKNRRIWPRLGVSGL